MDMTNLLKPFLTAVLPTIVLALGTYIAYMSSTEFNIKSKYYEKQLLEFYHPVFLYLEPYLFKSLTKDTAVAISAHLDDMCKANLLLVNDRILDHVRLMMAATKDNENYNKHFCSICAHVDNDLSNLQCNLGLPRRGFIYRANHGQLTCTSVFHLNVLKEFLFKFFLPMLCLVLFMLISANIVSNY